MSIVGENGTSRGVEIDTSVQADNQAETSEKAPETPVKRPEIIKITPKDADFSRNLAKFMQDFHTVSTAFIMVGIASVLLTIVGVAQGFLEMIRDSVGEVVFG